MVLNATHQKLLHAVVLKEPHPLHFHILCSNNIYTVSL